MRDSSYNSYTQTKQIHSRGGEKKVMKKSLSLLLAISLVFGLFASMASAADAPALTTAEKYKWFVDAGILKGTPDGGAHEADKLTRAEFATIAIAAAGLTAATSGQTFSDVKKGQWYYGAIQAASKAGLVNGIGKGKFGPKTNVTVESIIKVAVLIAKLDVVAGTTVAGASDWAAPYVKAALDAGLITAQASYKGQATRGDVINIAFAVVAIKAVPTLKDVNAKVNADDTITVTGTVYGKADSVKVALGTATATATAVAATLKADGTFSYTTAKQVAGDYKVTVVAYDGAKASVAVEKTVTIEKFMVSSVTVQNSKQIVVKFNKAVKEGILAGGHNYKSGTPSELRSYQLGATSSAYPSSAALSADKLTVTLTFASPFLNNSIQQLLISGLKSDSGLNLVEYKQAISLVDVTAPSIAKVSYNGLVASVELSEPVNLNGNQLIAAVSVNGIQITASSPIAYTAAADPATGYVTLTFTGLEVGKSYAVNIIAIEDLVGNRTDLTTTLAVTSDAVAPAVVSVTAVGDKVKIKFSEKVKAGVKVTSNISALASVYSTAEGDEVEVNTSSWIVAPATFLNTTITISDYKDLQDNAGIKFTQALTLTKDKTVPALATSMVAGNKIVIKFNEDLVAGTLGVAGATYNVVFNHTSTDSVKTTGTLASTVSYSYDAGANGTMVNGYIVLDVTATSVSGFYGAALKDGKYEIILPIGSVVDGAGNSNTAAITVTINVSGNTSTSSNTTALVPDSVATATYDEGIKLVGGKLYFTFNNDLVIADLVPSNFLINGTALPASTVLYFDTTKKVVVAELPAGSVPVNGVRTVKVTNIAGLNTSATANVQRDVALLENVKPTIISASILTNRTINVTLSENVSGATVAAPGFEIWINGVKVDLTGKVASVTNGTNVTAITLNVDTFAAGQTVLVKAAGSAIADDNGNKVTDGQVTAQ